MVDMGFLFMVGPVAMAAAGPVGRSVAKAKPEPVCAAAPRRCPMAAGSRSPDGESGRGSWWWGEPAFPADSICVHYLYTNKKYMEGLHEIGFSMKNSWHDFC
jgi:hypothetical protein